MCEKISQLVTRFSRALRLNSRMQKGPQFNLDKPREMSGFFTTLTDKQKERALAYRGDENHGDTTYKIGR